MANYREHVIYSATSQSTGNISLWDYPSAYNYLKISHGTNGVLGTYTSLNNMGPVVTDYVRTAMNYVSLYTEFFGGVSTASANSRYKAASMYSGTTGKEWTKVFQSYGAGSNSAATSNAGWNNIYMVVGVQSGSAGYYYHNDLLYDRDRDGSTVTLSKHPSGYRRIGIYCRRDPISDNGVIHSIERYSEVPYYYLANFKSSYFMPYTQMMDLPISSMKTYMGIALYSGCSAQSWTRKYGQVFQDSATTGTVTTRPVISRVVGIDRI